MEERDNIYFKSVGIDKSFTNVPFDNGHYSFKLKDIITELTKKNKYISIKKGILKGANNTLHTLEVGKFRVDYLDGNAFVDIYHDSQPLAKVTLVGHDGFSAKTVVKIIS